MYIWVPGGYVNYFYENAESAFLCISGCYGESLYLGYRPEYEQLLSMGWVLAFCHVRGGGEGGRWWHHEGQGERKMNTFRVRGGMEERGGREGGIIFPICWSRISMPVWNTCNLGSASLCRP